jgi:psp operon transcriptional activator
MQLCSELGWELFAGFTAQSMAHLQGYRWPGNVRELKNAVERSLYRWADPLRPVGEVVIDPFQSPYADSSPAAPAQAADDAPGEAAHGDFTTRMAQIEQQLLREALLENGQHQGRTAESLGLSYDQLRHLIRKHGLAGRARRKKSGA